MRKPIIVGNWKMNVTLHEAERLVEGLKPACEADAVVVVLCPPFTALRTVGALLDESFMVLGAQDMFWEPHGAFTGEISPLMLRDVGCRYVILGHSERRMHCGEADQMVHRKLVSALTHELTPIVCIGETLAEREGGKTFEILERQLTASFEDCERWDCGRVVLAYEPVWAVGTGHNATPEQAQEVHRFIRAWVSKRCGEPVGASMRIQYGGSVNPGNAASLLQQPDVDGALVGGASLKAEAFSAIVKAAIDVRSACGQVGAE